MLGLGEVDLGDLAMALEDHSGEHEWWLDPRTGELVLHSDGLDDEDRGDPDERGLVFVDPIDSSEAYRDMEDFVGRVADARARELLARAIAGRGAFRRFKDTLLELPALREAWFAFHDARIERRALAWLGDRGLVAADEVQRAAAERPDPELAGPSGRAEPVAVARAVAADLRSLYGDRLRRVVLYGSQARGDAHEESDIDLLVVLDRVDARRSEARRMSDVLFEHSIANDVVVTEVPVSEDEFRRSDEPLLVRARAEGIPV